MSSLRNAVKRVTHKERSQPQSRSHLGILEKKKDYRVRARDFHNKEDRIRSMREKVSMRNPDEFYFGMNRAEVKDGRHKKTEEARRKELEEQGLGPDAIKIMKNQDLSYVRMQKQLDSKRVEKMQASLHFLDAGDSNPVSKKRKHSIFVDNASAANTFDVAEHFDTAPELAGRVFNRPRLEFFRKSAKNIDEYDVYYDEGDEAQLPPLTEKQLAKQAKEARVIARKLAKARSAAYAEMEARTQRIAAMDNAEAHLVTEKLVAGKGRRRKIKGAEDGKPAVYRWRRKRAR